MNKIVSPPVPVQIRGIDCTCVSNSDGTRREVGECPLHRLLRDGKKCLLINPDDSGSFMILLNERDEAWACVMPGGWLRTDNYYNWIEYPLPGFWRRLWHRLTGKVIVPQGPRYEVASNDGMRRMKSHIAGAETK